MNLQECIIYSRGHNTNPLKTSQNNILHHLEIPEVLSTKSKHRLRREHEIGVVSKVPVGRNKVSARHVYSLLGEELQKLPNPHLGRSHLACLRKKLEGEPSAAVFVICHMSKNVQKILR